MTVLEELKQKRDDLNLEIEFTELDEYFYSLFNTATYNSYKTATERAPSPLFSLEADYYLRKNALEKHIKAKAKFYKDMDPAEAWPFWKINAYRLVKRYQELYNLRKENFNGTFL